MGAPEEQDGLSPITLSYSRKITFEKATFRDCAADTRVFAVDLLPPLDPPALLWSVRMWHFGSFRIPRSVPTEEELCEPALP